MFGAEETFLSSVFFDLQYLFLVLISILMMTHLILPLFPGFRMKLKIGMGVLFTALSPAVAIIIQFVVGTDSSHSLAHLLWLIVPTVFLAFGHTNFFTAGIYNL